MTEWRRRLLTLVAVSVLVGGCGDRDEATPSSAGERTSVTPAAEACRIASLDPAQPDQRAEMTAWARADLASPDAQAQVRPELRQAATTLALGLTAPGPTPPAEGIAAVAARVLQACRG